MSLLRSVELRSTLLQSLTQVENFFVQLFIFGLPDDGILHSRPLMIVCKRDGRTLTSDIVEADITSATDGRT